MSPQLDAQESNGNPTSDFQFPRISGVAQRANVIAYQVCQPGGEGDTYSGCFNSTSEVLRAGLRLLENNESQLKVLRDHLAKSEVQAELREFVDYSLNGLISEMDAEYESNKQK